MWWAQGCPGSDIAEIAEHLREQGWGETEIALEVAEAERLAEPGRVWCDNWWTAQVFLRCQWTLIATGLSRPEHQGIASAEIHANCALLRIPPAEWPHIASGVRLMASAARDVLNERKD